MTIVKKTTPGLVADPVEATESEKSDFVSMLTSLGVPLHEILEAQFEVYRSYKKTGNAYLMLTEVTVGGVPSLTLDVLDPLEVMYLNTKPNEPRSFVVSPNLADPLYFVDGPIEVVRKYPNWTQVDQNIRRTIFHVVNRRDHSRWYGRPDTLQSMYWQFVEWQYANLTAKTSSTEIAAKGLLLLQRAPSSTQTAGGESQALNIKKVGAAIRQVTTNRGKFGQAESLGVMDYPHEVSNPPELLKLDVNRDYQHLTATLNFATNYVYASHRWSKVLNGFERPASGIGGNVLIDEFLTKNTSTIIPTQRTWETFWGGVYREIATIAGAEPLGDLCHRYPDNVSVLVDSLRGVAVESINSMRGIAQTGGSDG